MWWFESQRHRRRRGRGYKSQRLRSRTTDQLYECDGDDSHYGDEEDAFDDFSVISLGSDFTEGMPSPESLSPSRQSGRAPSSVAGSVTGRPGVERGVGKAKRMAHSRAGFDVGSVASSSCGCWKSRTTKRADSHAGSECGSATSHCLKGPQATQVRVTFDWDGVHTSGSLSMARFGSVAELLQAVVELGEDLNVPNVSATQSQVFFATKRGESKKMYVTKTKWEELRQAQGLLVQKISKVDLRDRSSSKA